MIPDMNQVFYFIWGRNMFKDVNGLIDKVFTNNNGKWELYFYKASHRTFKVRKVEFPEGALALVRDNAVDKLIDKLETIPNMVDYKTFEDTDSVKRLDLNDECIKDMFEKFLLAVDNKDVKNENEDNAVLSGVAADGYFLVKTLEEDDDKKLYLFSKSKLVPKKSLELINTNDDVFEVVDSSKYVSLSNKINFIVYDNYLYSLDYKFEKVFFVGNFLNKRFPL